MSSNTLRRIWDKTVHRKKQSLVEEEEDTLVPDKRSESGLFLLNDGVIKNQDSNKKKFDVDIVAIHGLNGDAYNTWTFQKSTDNRCLWLRDLLPDDIPGARIFTYGYPAKAIFSSSKAMVPDFASWLLVSLNRVRMGKERRPIIFIAHSLGGIVLKQALLSAKEDLEYSDMFQSTKAALFFATPHRGSRGSPELVIFLGDVFDVCAKVTGARLLLGRTTRSDLLENLKSNSQELRRISTSFRHVVEQLRIVSLYETKEQKPLGRLVVEKDSALMDVGGETIFPMPANHTDICRFSDAKDQMYQNVAGILLKICDNVCYEPSLKESEKARIRLFNEVDIQEYRSTLPQRVDGTCSWVIESAQYRSWVHEEGTSLLWISGHAGSGKTILSAYLTEELAQKGTVFERDPLVCYFFCNDAIGNQRDAKAILRSIIFQLLLERRDMMRYVKPYFTYDKEGTQLFKSHNSLWAIFSSIANDVNLGQLCVIIDALDECEKMSRNWLLASISRLIDKLRNLQSRSVRFLITSRPYLTITDCFTSYEPLRLPLEEKQAEIDKDIRLVIQKRMEQIAKRTRAKQDTIALLEKSLTQNADRTFLWAKFALDILGEELLSAPGDFQRILAELPRDLEATYERFLKKVQAGRESFAVDILYMLLASFRPMTLDEINIAAAMQGALDDGCRNITLLEEKYLRTNIEADINKVLGPLVRISDSKVYVVHISLKEYLTTSILNLEDKQMSTQYHVDMHQAHLFLASASINYLLLEDFGIDLFEAHRSRTSGDIPSSSDSISRVSAVESETESSLFGMLLQEEEEIDAKICPVIAQRYAFFDYSALYWARHFSESQRDAPEELCNSALQIGNTSGHHFVSWFRFFWVYNGAGVVRPKNFDNLTVAGFFNHICSLDLLLRQSEEDHDNGIGESLYWASRNGHEVCVKRLLETKIEPDIKTINGHNALCIAAAHGHVKCVQILIDDERVNVNFEGRSGKTPISLAAVHGHSEVVGLLVNHDHVNPDAKDFGSMTPLMWAIRAQSAITTSLLVNDKRININNIDKRMRTPFSFAAEEGDETVAAILLKRPGIDVDSADEDGTSPLAWAARGGCDAVIKQLKTHKKLNNTHSHRDKEGRNAISWACWRGKDSTIRLLSKYKVPGLDEEDDLKWTPLFWAFEALTSSTVRTLLSLGSVNVNHRDHSGRTVLSWAAGSGREDVVRVLLAADGLDAMVKDDEGQTPLDMAQRFGKQGTRILLEDYLSTT